VSKGSQEKALSLTDYATFLSELSKAGFEFFVIGGMAVGCYAHLKGERVLSADPFDLLENKLRVNRPKDRPHIEHLLRFIEEEAVEAFTKEGQPRERLAPVRRLLVATRSKTIPERLAARLVLLAEVPPDFRFLANSVPEREHATALLERARSRGEDLAEEVRVIIKRRRFPRQNERVGEP
jgi:hypothetical protein